MNYYNIYTEFIKKFFNISHPIKIVFDCSNGTTGLVLKKIKNKNLKLIIINEKPDGRFPAHGPDPLKPGAIFQLQKAVKKNRADAGVIFDADGDRVFFIDNLGRFIDPDIITYLLARKFKPPFIVDVRTGKLIEEFKKTFIKSRVGHYFIKKLMISKKIEFAAERSGHYYFNIDNAYFDSGIIAAFQVLNELSRLPYTLADLADFLPQYHRSGEINLAVKNPIEALKKMENKYRYQAKKISRLDGLTMEFNDYWFNIRPSNTEPVIRLNIESMSKKVLLARLKALKKEINLL